jgi:hypothetical protein
MDFLRFPIWPPAFSHGSNDQPSVFSSHLKPLPFADNAGIIYHPESDCFQNCITDAFASLNKWVKANNHGLYLDKMNSMKLSAKIKTYMHLNVRYGNKTMKVVTSKFLGLKILSNLNWDYIKHIWDMFPIVVQCDCCGPEPSHLR